MRRINRSAGIVALAVLTIGAPASRSDDQPRAVDAVDRVLAEWQAKASAIQSVEVKFLRTDHSPGWGDTRFQGRAILASTKLAQVEFFHVNQDGKATVLQERLIWNGRTTLQFDPEIHRVFRLSHRDEWPVPGLLRIPFLYRMTVEDAKRDYAWEVFREDQERILLRVSPKARSARSMGFWSCILELDRKTFLPRQMIVTSDDGKDRRTFQPIDIRINAVKETEELTDPCLDAWTVSEVDCDAWPARLFLK